MLVDGALALLVFIDTFIRTLHHSSPLAQSILLLGVLALAARRAAPLAVLVSAVASLVAFSLLGGELKLLPFALLIALYTVALTFPPGVSLGAALFAIVGLAAAMAVSRSFADDEVFDRFPLVAAAWLLGYGSRLVDERAALMERESARLRVEDETRTRLAVLEEQARIARELHDIVAHHLTLIVAQATAALSARGRPADTVSGGDAMTGSAAHPDHQVLHAIAASGREALGELRGLVGALHPGTDPIAGTPEPWLAQVRTLISRVERSGLSVELIVRGRPRPLPMNVELGAYRIIQEALTNALRHAGPTKAEVELDYQADQLALRISNGGSVSVGGAGTSAIAPGYGVLGMVQRAAVLGGRISVGPVPDHGFQVSARLPVYEG